jgi:hypothetical protein
MSEDSAEKIPAKTNGYVRENWGAPFVIAFMLLLVVAAALLAIGLDFLADEVAVGAYFALVAGVVLQLVCFLKYGEKGEAASAS